MYNNLSRHTLEVLYKLTVRLVIDYALPVYYNTLKKSELAQLENLQYRAAKIVTGTFHFTNKDKLYNELGWESIQQCARQSKFEFFSQNSFARNSTTFT